MATLSLMVTAGVAIRSFFHETEAVKNRQSDWIWGFFIFGVLLAGRWPGLFRTREYNPDESQLIAGAMTLRHDPLFWRSVDGGTAGPLDFYALQPAGWLLGSDGFAAATLTALVLIGGAILLIHQVLAHFFGRAVARAATLGTVALEAFSLHPDFLHYSTELVPIFLIAAAIYAGLVGFSRDPLSAADGAVAGLLLGAAPLAKLQATPLAGVIGLWFVASACLAAKPWTVRVRRLIALIAAAAAPAIGSAIILAAAGEGQNAVIPYLKFNLSYVNGAYFTVAQWGERLRAEMKQPGTLFLPWLAGIGAGTLLAVAGLTRMRGKWFHPLLFFSVTLLAVSAFGVFVPRRPFLHYFQFSILPITLLLGTLLGLATHVAGRTRASSLAVFLSLALMVGVLPIAVLRAPIAHPDVGRLALYQSSPRGLVAREILRYARPGECLALWGWGTNFYVETGLWQATRNAFSQTEIIESPFQDYFRRRYLADVMRNHPPVLIDTTESGRSTFPTQPLAAEEIFPELAAFLRQNYTRVPDVTYVRMYVRNDRLPASAK